VDEELQPMLVDWHNEVVLSPWVIQELEEERRRREEEDRARSQRIELPQVVEERSEEARSSPGGVVIVDISPHDESVIDI
jgi:hypothetical protein